MQPSVLITGASGEIGHGLIDYLAEEGASTIVTLDLKKLENEQRTKCAEVVDGSILDEALVAELFERFGFERVYHLAAVLSTGGEREPAHAQAVNVQGSVVLLEQCRLQTERSGKPVRIIYPSSIAVYGVEGGVERGVEGSVAEMLAEDDFLKPTTMYGVNKLSIEQLGRYYSKHFRALDPPAARIDFRCLRFPGILSADTVPSAGTSDYGPEMLHAAAQGRPYDCFVPPEAKLPFMVLPDAVRSLIMLADAKPEQLSRCVYNVGAFSITAAEILEHVREGFSDVEIGFAPDERRLQIVESWPRSVDDSAARNDWGWAHEFDAQRAFDEYLIPGVKNKYKQAA